MKKNGSHETKTCSQGKYCKADNPEQPLDQFASPRRVRPVARCQTCRDYLNGIKRRSRRAQRNGDKPEGRLNGYGPLPPRVFSLAHHHYLVAPPAGHELRTSWDETATLKLLTAPDGRVVARRHADLQPGEISFVLR